MKKEVVHKLLDYCPETGFFRWRVSRPPRAKAGAIAGYDNGGGYIKISIGGKRYYAHRLAFLMMTGEIPPEIDHINHCRSDNRWVNLRPADRISNCSNVAGRSGVRKRYGRWYARYSHSHLGVFDTEAEAVAARRAAEIRAAGLDPNANLAALPQAIPKRQHKAFTFKGKSLSEWSRITGIPQTTLYWRIHKAGVPPELAVAGYTTR